LITKCRPNFNQSINQSIFICSKCPEIHIKGFSIASRTTGLRPAPTAVQLIKYTMKEKEKLNVYKIAYGGVHIHCTRFYLKLITVTKIPIYKETQIHTTNTRRLTGRKGS